MQVANLLPGFPSNISEKLSWTKSASSSKPYRVWVLEDGDDNPKPIGIMAKSLKELKEKANTFVTTLGTSSEGVEIDKISILTMDNTFITDEEYFSHFSNSEDLVMLLPGQSWRWNLIPTKSSVETEKNDESSLVRRKYAKSDFRYFVPTPEGQMARVTLDVFRPEPTDAGSVRLTAATAGETAVAVSYEVKLNGFRTALHYTSRCAAFLLTHLGHALVNTGELLKQYLE